MQRVMEKVFRGTSASPVLLPWTKARWGLPLQVDRGPPVLSPRTTCHPALTQYQLPQTTQSCWKAEALIWSKGRVVPTLFSQRDLSVCFAVSQPLSESVTVSLETGHAEKGR